MLPNERHPLKAMVFVGHSQIDYERIRHDEEIVLLCESLALDTEVSFGVSDLTPPNQSRPRYRYSL